MGAGHVADRRRAAYFRGEIPANLTGPQGVGEIVLSC
jgi:hypothetical protein